MTQESIGSEKVNIGPQRKIHCSAASEEGGQEKGREGAAREAGGKPGGEVAQNPEEGQIPERREC